MMATISLSTDSVIMQGNLCITPCGLWSAGLGRSTSLFFLPIAIYKAAKKRLVAHPEPTATASPELCRGSQGEI